MTETATTRPPASTRAGADKRQALLDAARRLIARSGLHNTPTSAVAREAGVAAGTLYLYFPSKEALINALYLELVAEQARAAAPDGAPPDDADPRALLWHSWHGLARWHLDHPDASNVIHQCRASGILSPETRDAEQRARVDGLTRFEQAIALGVLRDLPSQVFWALYVGPIFVLVESRVSREIEVTDDVLRATFEGVCRSVLPAAASPAA
jgi:AcrR family transcriptional regulator